MESFKLQNQSKKNPSETNTISIIETGKKRERERKRNNNLLRLLFQESQKKHGSQHFCRVGCNNQQQFITSKEDSDYNIPFIC